MSLRDEAKKIIADLLGPGVAAQVDTFDDPEKYPGDFLEECVFFLGKFVGEKVAEDKFKHLTIKYNKRGIHE